MLTHEEFVENMAHDSQFLFLVVSTLLEQIDRKISYVDANRKTYRRFDRLLDFNWSATFDLFREKVKKVDTHKVTPEDIPPLAVQYTLWAFRQGYLAEASRCAAALRELNLWEEK